MVPVDCTTSMRMILPFSGTGKDSDRFSCGILLYRLGRTRSTTEPATGEWRRLPCRSCSTAEWEEHHVWVRAEILPEQLLVFNIESDPPFMLSVIV